MFDPVGVVEVGGKLAGADPGAGSDRELCEAAIGLARLQSLVAVAQGHVLAELDARGVCDREFGLSTGSWLAREASMPGVEARQLVKVGATLRSTLDRVDDAVASGRIGFGHARVLTAACNPRVVDAVAGMQAELIGLAVDTNFERWRAEVRGIVELLDADGGHDPAGDVARNQLSIAETLDGVTHLAGQLVGEHALGVRQAIDTKADELFHRLRVAGELTPDLPVPPRATLRALALAELCHAGGAVDLNATRPPRPQVTLVVNAEDPDQVVTPDGVRLADGTTRTLRCDPDLYAVVVDSLGVPLDLGRNVRLATAAQRRALAVRDGGCIWPGCTLPAHWTDAHHLDRFRTGGNTNLERLASLCRYHHGVIHRTGWTMHANPDGWFWFQTPTGLTFWSQRHHRRRTDPPPAGGSP